MIWVFKLEEGVMLWLKLTPTIPSRQRQLCTAKKYSSDNSERTEENNCRDCLQHSNEMLQKTLCVNEITNLFHY